MTLREIIIHDSDVNSPDVDLNIFMIVWNRFDLFCHTVQSLREVIRRSCLSCRLSVVDNGSQEQDRMLEYLRSTEELDFNFFGFDRNLGICNAYNVIFERFPGFLSNDFIMFTDADMVFIDPLDHYIKILDRRPEIAVAGGQHSPEHPVVGRGPGFLLKRQERGCHMVLRSRDFHRLLPLPRSCNLDFDWWIVQRAPKSVQKTDRFCAVIPGGVRHLGAKVSTWSQKELPEYSEDWLEASRRRLQHTEDLSNFDIASWFLTQPHQFDAWVEWTYGAQVPASEKDDEFDAKRSPLSRWLMRWIDTPESREILELALPGVEQMLERWHEAPTSSAGRKTEQTLVRCLSHLASGDAFCSFSMGWSLAGIRKKMDRPTVYRRQIRLRSAFLWSLARTWSLDPSVRRELEYFPNPTLSQVFGEMRHLEAHQQRDGTSWSWFSVERCEALEIILDRATVGARIPELVRALVEGIPELCIAEAEEFLEELIETTILEPDLDGLLAAPPRAVQKRLAEVHKIIATLDGGSLGTQTEARKKLKNTLQILGGGSVIIPLEVYAESPPPIASLSSATIQELRRGAEILFRLARPVAEQLKLLRFRERFIESYAQLEIPLVEALSSLGFESEIQDVVIDPREDYLLQKVGETLMEGDDEMVLDPSDLEKLEDAATLLSPDSFELFVTFMAPSREALTEGDFQIVLEALKGPASAMTLGRTQCVAGRLQQQVEERIHTEEAQVSGAVFAEVVDLPNSSAHSGNNADRPLYPLSLPVWSVGRSLKGLRLPLSDLLISMVDGQAILRSSATGLQVIPRMALADDLGPVETLPLVRFLRALRNQDRVEHAAWDWGRLSRMPFLPRVSFDRFVLARARWRLLAKEIAQITQAEGAGARFWALQTLRQRRRLPRWLQFDNMAIDLDNILSAECFVEGLSMTDSATLEEIVPPPIEPCACGQETPVASRLVVPFFSSKPIPTVSPYTSTGQRPIVSQSTVWRCPRSGRIDLVFAGSHCGSPHMARPCRFIELLQLESQARNLEFLHCASSAEADYLRTELVAGSLEIGAVVNYTPSDPYFRSSSAFLDAVKDRGGLLLNDPVRTQQASKATMQVALARAGMTMPRTVIWRAWKSSRDLTDSEREFLGPRIVCKPSKGGGGWGVSLNMAGTFEALEEVRAYDPEDDYLLQEFVDPIELDGRPAWFRVYYCMGRTFPCFWTPGRSASTFQWRYPVDLAEMIPVEPEDIAIYKLEELNRIILKIATLSGLEWFSCEIALTLRDGQRVFLPIDPINDACYARTQIEVGAKGMPDSVAEAITEHLVGELSRHSSDGSWKSIWEQ